MADATPNIHAPWSKRILIPLWVVQLGVLVTQIALTLQNFAWLGQINILRHWGELGHAWVTPYILSAWAVNLILEFVITGLIIIVIVKFAHFTLTTAFYRKQGVTVVGLGVLGEVLYVASVVKGGGYQDCVLVGLLVLVSVGGWWYVLRIGRLVGRGEVEEMARQPEMVGEMTERGS